MPGSCTVGYAIYTSQVTIYRQTLQISPQTTTPSAMTRLYLVMDVCHGCHLHASMIPSAWYYIPCMACIAIGCALVLKLSFRPLSDVSRFRSDFWEVPLHPDVLHYNSCWHHFPRSAVRFVLTSVNEKQNSCRTFLGHLASATTAIIHNGTSCRRNQRRYSCIPSTKNIDIILTASWKGIPHCNMFVKF